MSDRGWTPLPLDGKMFLNADETSLSRANAKVENAYASDVGGFTRFPGFSPYLQLPDRGRVFPTDWRGDLMAGTTKGRLYRIDQNKNAEDVTGVPIAGGGRIIFDRTEDELLAAAGGQIIRFAGHKTEVLSEDAPLTTHVGTIDGFVLGIVKNSQRLKHSNAGASRTWSPLDEFAADRKPDLLTSMMITPFGEILLCGPDSIEQWERTNQGDTPFFRRWPVGESLKAPYAIGFADNAAYCVNKKSELVRLSGQSSQPAGDDIGKFLASIDDWSEAWIGGNADQALAWEGQSFFILQAPNATNPYGTKGVTVCLDYRKQRFFLLYGWDAKQGRPARWPGWSHWQLGSDIFVGGDDGWIWKLDSSVHSYAGEIQRFLVRTGHWDQAGECVMDDLRVRIKRGGGSNTVAPTILVRANRDNEGFGPWVQGSLGLAGQREMLIRFGGFGIAYSWQLEIQCTDDAPVEFVKAEALLTPTGN